LFWSNTVCGPFGLATSLLMRTLRDMNLSKLVAQDVPLFLSMLADLFPALAPPPKAQYPDLERALAEAIDAAGLTPHPTFVAKIVQLHETCLVRHGIMLCGECKKKAKDSQWILGSEADKGFPGLES
jgi:hypothetical protein